MDMGSSLIGAVIGGIIATSIGIFLHYSVGDMKQKKRLCMALYDELKLNHKYLTTSFSFRGEEYCAPYRLVLSSYTDARNYGLVRELPEDIGTKIENCYTFLQNLDTYRFGIATKGGEILLSEPKNEEVDEVVKMIDEILPKLKEFYFNLCIYPHDYIAYRVRKIRRIS
jgi:hypothetical protein